MPLWGWIFSGFAIAIFFVRSAMLKNRAKIEREFVYYLQEHHPDLSFVRQVGKTMFLRYKESEVGFYMQRLYTLPVRPDDVAGRRRFYENAALKVIERIEPREVRPESLRPRLVNATKYSALGEIPSRKIEALGLHLVYVLDGQSSVRYVTRELADQLALDEPGLYARALANLQPSLPAAIVRGALEGKKVQVLKLLDGHDAARLLLIPSLLAEGESVAALIPDVNSLVIVLPRGDDYAALKPLGGGGEVEISDGVFKVTSAGFERMV